MMRRFFIIFFLFILLLVLACSTPSWFPIKKGAPHKAKMKELLDKEVIIIDREEYVKVSNPKISEGGNQPKFLYIPVNEYLSKKETFITPPPRREEPKKESSFSMETSSAAKGKDTFSVTSFTPLVQNLKKKVVVAHFDDQTTTADEKLGDWVTEKLMKEVDRKSQRILFVDYPMVEEFLQNRGLSQTDLEMPKTLRLLNEVFGIHVLVTGKLSGPYVFTTKGPKEQMETASAILKIEMKLVDTSSGKILKNLSANNPILATKEKGSFSEEKAKVKAIDLTLDNLGGSLIREVENLDWFCRIAKVEGEEIYLNAGRLTGLRVGDMMEVLRPGQSGERGEVKGRIRILACFGIDASMGRLVDGKQPDMNDILKITKREGT